MRPEGLPESPEGLSEGREGLLEGPGGLLEGSEGLPKGLEGLSEGSEGLPEGPRRDGWTYGWTEFLPILQEFVPCWGRCPKKARSQQS